jgi:hypothetical protein
VRYTIEAGQRHRRIDLGLRFAGSGGRFDGGVVMNALELAQALQDAAQTFYGKTCGLLWDGGATIRKLHAENEANERNLGILSDELSKCEKHAKDLQTECTALRVNEENLTAKVESLRAQLAARVPDVCSKCQGEGRIYQGCGDWIHCSHCNTTGKIYAAPSQQAPVTQGEPIGYMNAGHIHELQQGRAPYGYVYQKAETGASVAVFTTPQQASKPMTDELESALEALVNRCNNDAGLTNDAAVIAAEAALERLYKARAVERHHKIGGE